MAKGAVLGFGDGSLARQAGREASSQQAVTVPPNSIPGPPHPPPPPHLCMSCPASISRFPKPALPWTLHTQRQAGGQKDGQWQVGGQEGRQRGRCTQPPSIGLMQPEGHAAATHPHNQGATNENHSGSLAITKRGALAWAEDWQADRGTVPPGPPLSAIATWRRCFLVFQIPVLSSCSGLLAQNFA